MDQAVFESFIAEALAMIPDRIRKGIKNVAFLVETGQPRGPLLGLYRGIPVSRRSHQGYSGVLPDTITIFQEPIVRQAGPDPEAIRKLTHEVVHHEVGHYFGFDEAEVRRWEKNRRQKNSAQAAGRNMAL